ncbi:hypothetical protein ASAP_1599 [Asaia bogorensis]|uniref:Uncharacterized protein n=1 Tax=Asaia bogorensis TaxID=91915 RepID=A0A060QEU7_9PROT|nr:hypothetical protein ASAP_1599 [Asaia bogorensis]
MGRWLYDFFLYKIFGDVKNCHCYDNIADCLQYSVSPAVP